VSEGGGLGGKDEGRKKERKNGILIRGVDSGVERKERRETKRGGGGKVKPSGGGGGGAAERKGEGVRGRKTGS
jgi:hypothetical protein